MRSRVLLTLAISVAATASVLAGGPARAATAFSAATGYTPPTGVSYACQQSAGPDATCAGLTDSLASTATSPPAGLDPAGIRGFYRLPSATQGYQQTVAVVGAYNYVDAAADLSAYRTGYGIPACTTANGCFKVVDVASGNLQASAGWDVGEAQAMDMISAVCPNCHILLVQAQTTGIADTDGLGAAENEAVAQGADFIVDPWAVPEASVGTSETSDDAYFDHPGVVITAPGLDTGYTQAVSYPAASPYVIAVGGTTLTPSGSTYTETAWDGTQSGCSAYDTTKPAWQTASPCAGRAVNDVAAVADPADNIVFYDSDYNSAGWGTGGGTTYAAGIVAAAAALAGKPADDSNPASYLYSNANGLNDISTGSTGTCAVIVECTAGTGWDGPTGVGSPDGVSAFLSGYYQPITPTRFMDTRNGTGGTTGPIAADGTVKLQITGEHGIPADNVTGVVLNLTAVSESSSGILDAYQDGWPRPTTSTLNYQAGTTLANLVIVPVGADGAIDIFNASGGTVQLVGDVSGYFTSDATAAGDTTYTPVTPVRILDTATGTGAPQKPLAGQGTLAVQVGGANAIPSGVSAVAINITAAAAMAPGILSAYADGTSPLPLASNLQFGLGNIAEMAIVPVGADGKIDIHGAWNDTSDTVTVIGDVVGYFSAGTSGETYHAIGATRMIDTRQSSPIAAGGTLGIPQGNTVVAPSPTLIANVIVTDGTAGGDFIIYPAGVTMPGTSNLNWQTGLTIDNLDLAETGGGTFDIHNASSGTADAVVDCTGYFAAG